MFLLNSMRRNESFDMMVFFSTGVDTLEGERQYRLVFSYPDFDRRQGKIYPFAVDFLLNYDIWINNSFFGAGNDSEFDDREYYTREPFEVSLTLSRGFTPHTVGEIGTRFKTVRNSNFSSGSQLAQLGGLNTSRVTYASLFTAYRYDTRDIFTNPSRGVVMQGELEYVPDTGFSDVAFTRWAGEFQYYAELFYPTTILAARLRVQGLTGDNLPVQVMLPIGGSRTLRGFPQDRFLDHFMAVANLELRFPLKGRFGGVAGLDAGKVWNSPGDINFSKWALNRVVGLRFYMQTFLVRIDLGFGPETTGLYFNFGHAF
jgi:outer membrane protein assembly factor BamA